MAKKKQTESKDAKNSKPAPKQKEGELSEKDLDGVAGGMIAGISFPEDDDGPVLLP